MKTNAENSQGEDRAAGGGRRARLRAAAAVGLLLTLVGALGGCLEADTLGDEPPDEVTVGSPPRWDNGMQDLMTLKCGVCHRVPRPKSAPEETPDELDFTILTGGVGGGEDGVDGAADALDDIQEQVQEGKMPLDYATPLTDAERAAILDWDGN